jgi:hypothetical protein
MPQSSTKTSGIFWHFPGWVAIFFFDRRKTIRFAVLTPGIGGGLESNNTSWQSNAEGDKIQVSVQFHKRFDTSR